MEGKRARWVWCFAGLFTLSLALAWHSETGKAAPPRSAARSNSGAESPGSIDVERSRVYVFVRKSGLGHEHAVEGRVKSGTIHLGQAKKSGALEFDMTSFDADTEAARKYLSLKGTTSDSVRQKVNDNMLGGSVLDVERFPTATFAIESAQQVATKGKTPRYQLKGKFTLHGQTREVTITADTTSQAGDKVIRLQGQFDILQTEFGITPYKAALGAVGVADQLTIYGDLWIAAEPTAKR